MQTGLVDKSLQFHQALILAHMVSLFSPAAGIRSIVVLREKAIQESFEKLEDTVVLLMVPGQDPEIVQPCLIVWFHDDAAVKPVIAQYKRDLNSLHNQTPNAYFLIANHSMTTKLPESSGQPPLYNRAWVQSICCHRGVYIPDVALHLPVVVPPQHIQNGARVLWLQDHPKSGSADLIVRWQQGYIRDGTSASNFVERASVGQNGRLGDYALTEA
ncbi:hypothetical protein C8J56DRAFT_890870 [Mycena floridula]|nr:hypothetical protein C8J56DRAFT_890870 [Mycena floridula]